MEIRITVKSTIVAIAGISHCMEHFHVIAINLATKLQTILAFLNILTTTKVSDSVQFCTIHFQAKCYQVNADHDFNNCESNGIFSRSLNQCFYMRLLPYYCNIQRKNDGVFGRQSPLIACSF